MTRHRIVPSSSRLYIESPLGQIIAAALAKINELKLKYPLVTKAKKSASELVEANSPELVYTHEKIEIVFNLLQKTNAFLKKFDNYQTPEVGLSILRELGEIKKLQDKLVTRKAELFQNIKNELPNLIQKAQTETKISLKKTSSVIKESDSRKTLLIEAIRWELDKYKEKLKVNAGKDFNRLFQEIVDCILLDKNLDIDAEALTCCSAIVSVESQLFADDMQSALSIEHPMAYEFILFIADLLWQRPTQFAQLVPFLNPQILNIDLHTGIVVGPLVRKAFGGYSYLTKLDNSAPASDYQFQLLTYSENQFKGEEILNGAQLYLLYFDGLLNAFTSQLPKFFEHDSALPFVKSEQARSDLLQKLIICENKMLLERLASLPSEPNATEQAGLVQIKADLAELHTITALEQANKECEKRLQAIESLKEELGDLEALYERQTVKCLVKKYPDLEAQLESDKQNQFDLTYVENALPDNRLLVKPQAKVETILIKNALHDTFTECHNTLEQRLESIRVRQTYIYCIKNHLEAQETGEVVLYSESSIDESQECASLQSYLSLDSNSEPISVLLQKGRVWADKLGGAKAHSQSQIAAIQRDLLANTQRASSDGALDFETVRTHLGTQIVQLRQNALAICLQYGKLSQGEPADNPSFVRFLEEVIISLSNKKNAIIKNDFLRKQKLVQQKQVFQAINQSLAESKSSFIPFKKIDKNSDLQMYSMLDYTGFNLLLCLIGLKDKIPEWAHYRSKQESFFNKPLKEEVSKKNSELQSTIVSACNLLTLEIDKPLTEDGSFKQLAQHIQSLSDVKTHLERSGLLLTQFSTLDSHIDDYKKYEEKEGNVSELLSVMECIHSIELKIKQFNQEDPAVMNRIPEILALAAQIPAQRQVIETLAGKIAKHSHDFSADQIAIESVLKIFEGLTQGIAALKRGLLQSDYGLLQQRLEKICFDEGQTTLTNNETVLEEVECLLGLYECVEAHHDFVQFPVETRNVIVQKITKIRQINSQIEQRISERAREVDAIQCRLTTELNRCSLKEAVKKEFIEELQKYLAASKSTGDSKQAIAFIQRNIRQFLGQDFQVLLHQSVSTLMDLDNQIPVDYWHAPAVISHSKASEIVQKMPEKVAAKISSLYKLIDDVKQYGSSLSRDKKDKKNNKEEAKIVQDLAAKLSVLVDSFVVTNELATPAQKSENFKRFRAHFTHRAHSADDVLKRHNTIWKPLIANLLIGLLTVGIALGVKLIYSALVERRKSPLFFDRTKAQETLDTLETKIEALGQY